MTRRIALIAVAALLSALSADAQTRRTPARRPPAPPPPPVKFAPPITCSAPLGAGITTHQAYCDVMAGRDPATGVLIPLPPHKGPVTLTFDLHNRHTYSEEQMKNNRAYTRYTATIGVLTMDNTLISRAAVQSEFRSAADLVERIGGGAGPGGVKAVAPTGTEHITVTIPEAEEQVSLLGEKLMVDRAEGTSTYQSPGRPIAIVSNVMIEYQPPPPEPPARSGRSGGWGASGRSGGSGRSGASGRSGGSSTGTSGTPGN
jgi:uncharacterized membrane protein YgcG